MRAVALYRLSAHASQGVHKLLLAQAHHAKFARISSSEWQTSEFEGALAKFTGLHELDLFILKQEHETCISALASRPSVLRFSASCGCGAPPQAACLFGLQHLTLGLVTAAAVQTLAAWLPALQRLDLRLDLSTGWTGDVRVSGSEEILQVLGLLSAAQICLRMSCHDYGPYLTRALQILVQQVHSYCLWSLEINAWNVPLSRELQSLLKEEIRCQIGGRLLLCIDHPCCREDAEFRQLQQHMTCTVELGPYTYFWW